MDLEQLFTPLGKEYCIYFYYLSIFVFVFFCVALVSGLYIGIRSNEGHKYYFKLFIMCFTYLIMYFQDRLLYSMCVK